MSEQSDVHPKCGEFIYEVLRDGLRQRQIVKITKNSYMVTDRDDDKAERVPKDKVGRIAIPGYDPFMHLNMYYASREDAEYALQEKWRRNIEDAKDTIQDNETLLAKKIKLHRYGKPIRKFRLAH